MLSGFSGTGTNGKKETILDTESSYREDENERRSPCYKANSVKLCGRKSR